MSKDHRQDPNLEITGDSPVNVPAFACIVYVSAGDDGVRARVANLPDLQFTAPSEREVFGKVVPEFKKRISDWLTSEQEIPWIDPPLPMEADEQKRFLPVHL